MLQQQQQTRTNSRGEPYVIGPTGAPLTIADLPPVDTGRWVIRRKAEVVAAVRGGLLTLDEACERYSLTNEEFLAWQKSIDTNVRGALFLVQAALPQLAASPHASVVNLVSVGIFTSGQGVAIYIAGKAALMSLTRSMAAELCPQRIRVNALAPGIVDTDMMGNNPPEVQQHLLAGQPMGRMAQPDEMVPAALFLASDASSFMTGACLTIDGGRTMP